jgi:chromate transporter
MKPALPTALPADDAAPRPRSRADLFWTFTWLALQGFGGVLAVVQRELVEKKRWLTREQFLEEWAVAQIMPGPNVLNLAMVLGGRHFGLSGALAAASGLLALPLLLVLALAVLYGSVADTPVAQGALRGMGAVSAGLIAATGLKLAPALRSSPMGLAAAALVATLSFIAIAWLRLPLAWVLLIVGGLSCGWAAYRLRGIALRQEPR